jgi:hypothetical protein
MPRPGVNPAQGNPNSMPQMRASSKSLASTYRPNGHMGAKVRVDRPETSLSTPAGSEGFAILLQSKIARPRQSRT